MDVGDSGDMRDILKYLCPFLPTRLNLPSFSLLFPLSFDRSAVSQSGGMRFRSVARLIAYSRFTDICVLKNSKLLVESGKRFSFLLIFALTNNPFNNYLINNNSKLYKKY